MNMYRVIKFLEELYDYLDDSPDYREQITEIIEWLKEI